MFVHFWNLTPSALSLARGQTVYSPLTYLCPTQSTLLQQPEKKVHIVRVQFSWLFNELLICYALQLNQQQHFARWRRLSTKTQTLVYIFARAILRCFDTNLNWEQFIYIVHTFIYTITQAHRPKIDAKHTHTHFIEWDSIGIHILHSASFNLSRFVARIDKKNASFHMRNQRKFASADVLAAAHLKRDNLEKSSAFARKRSNQTIEM